MDFIAEYLGFLSSPAGWAALVTLVTMEIVLGIDNLIFISILTNKLPAAQQSRARRIGIGAALVLRLALLFTISIIVQLTEPVFTAFGHGFSWRDIILVAGGLFLVWKATKEIHHTVDPDDSKGNIGGKVAELTIGAAIVQILVLDLVFSVDSIITAVGMTDEIAIMIIAVLCCGDGDAAGRRSLVALHRGQPHHRHAGPGFSLDDRHDADCRRLRLSCAEGLYLCRDGFLGTGGSAEYAGPAKAKGTLNRIRFSPS